MKGLSLRVGLDIGWLGTQAEGIRHWTERTFGAMTRDNPGHRFTLVWPWPNRPLPAGLPTGPNVDVFAVCPNRRVAWRRVGRRLGLYDEARRAARRLASLDVLHWGFHAEAAVPWLHLFPQVPKVATLYDATPLTVPDTQPAEAFAEWRRHFARAKELGSWWMTISESAREDLVRLAGMDPARGYVVYPGHNFDGTDGPVPEGSLPPAVSADGVPYVLTVGTLEPRKNQARLFRAFRELVGRPEFAHWKLVSVGGRAAMADEALAEAARTPNLILAGRLSHADLAACYRHATVFAYPSLYEGFGLPVAEAMSFGLPVLTSTTSSLPEVAGNAAVLVDPGSDAAVRDGLKRLMADQDLRAALGASARSRAAGFDWLKSGRETMAILERVAATNTIFV